MTEFWFVCAAYLAVIACTSALAAVMLVGIIIGDVVEYRRLVWRDGRNLLLCAGVAAVSFIGMGLILNAIG